ncbi:MAG: T9SS type A sorting domain-containing protein, partial [Ignavibacteria bacterium]|nr:T9SS type A sorting domain-containing protein [Ignavibacteria bacterium]
SNRTISIDTVDATYTAKFLDEYNIMFQNSFSDATGGVINVNGSQTAPYQTVVLENDGITATAVSQGIDNITYYFTNWSTGSTNINETFYPISDTTIAANFVGIAAQSINLNFESSDPNLPITLHWTEYPNNNVTQYQIWRRIKYKKNPTEDPVLLATVNRGTTSYIDYDFYGTNLGYTDWMLWYDVRSYYSTEGTYPDPNWAQVFSGGLIREKPTDLEEKLTVVKENSLDNFPNPFNPSTVIQYQIVESGFVSVKVYDNLGREVDVLVNKEQQSGKYSVAFDASKLASGIYFYTINAKDFYKVKKMILLR